MTDLNRLFHGPNAGYVLERYEEYLHDPDSVDAAMRALFDRLQPDGDSESRARLVVPLAPPSLSTFPSPEKSAGAANLAYSLRYFGHLDGQLDPLGSPPPGDPWLTLDFHGITEDDLRQLPASLIGGPIASHTNNTHEAITELRSIYCRHTGHDSVQVRAPAERQWLREAAESRRFAPPQTPLDPVALLETLTRVEVFELFLHRMFPGKTRFSIEGLDVMVPMLDEMIHIAAQSGVRHVLMGMAHRGRLNVMTHILDVPYRQILAQFKDPEASVRFHYDLGWMGDVKYHTGVTLPDEPSERRSLTTSLAPNPSHLEAVNPVVLGMARAVGTEAAQPGPPRFDPAISLPIQIHGDASFPGQGVVAETLNLFRLPGYTTGGSIHIIANNQLGYTTGPEQGRSTLYASDLAKGFRLPIIHVNADEPEACIEAARTAIAYRQEFGKDFVIDLIGYRRYGHNEGDEPAFTQPRMYSKIEKHPTVRKQWAERLLQEGVLPPGGPDELVYEIMTKLQEELESLDPEKDLVEPKPILAPKGAARKVKTTVPVKKLRELNTALLQVPEGFQLHRKIARSIKQREQILKASDTSTVDWATAEHLALASILADGIPIRLTGEDVERGTFSQRHAVFHDTETGEKFTPLQNIPQARASFELHNSPLSENAVLAFEYGYNIQKPECLVLWEAQYGDFVNGAQVVIDEFITSARMKWDHAPSLVLLLPHGAEGAGPDHSNAWLARFLSMAAKTNLRITYPTTAAQYFHLLRRQALLLQTDPLPLIVMTPKSLLRHPLTASAPSALSKGGWQPVINDARALENPEKVRRLLLCSGKVYVDLVTSEYRDQTEEIAIVRVEQLYRFPEELVRHALESYPNLQEVFWVQEEPKNIGPWLFIAPRVEKIIAERWPFRLVGRYANASPAEGSATMFQRHQKMIVDAAFGRHNSERGIPKK